MVLRVAVEKGSRRSFAFALDWPGWCRSGRDEATAIEALVAYQPRYAAIARQARAPFGPRNTGPVKVLERVTGGATTDFGAPEKAVDADLAPLGKQQAERIVDLIEASWKFFDLVVQKAPPSLRKGPRGGGRDRDAIAQHVISAENAYARKLGIRIAEPTFADKGAVQSLRDAIVEVIRSARKPTPVVAKGWPMRYAARRIVWHVADHAWEIEDKS